MDEVILYLSSGLSSLAFPLLTALLIWRIVNRKSIGILVTILTILSFTNWLFWTKLIYSIWEG